MKHLIAALCLLIVACATDGEPDVTEMNAAQAMAAHAEATGVHGPDIQIAPAAAEHDHSGGISLTTAEGHVIPGQILLDPPRHPTHPARNRQLVIPSGPVVPALGRPAEMNALFFLAAGEGPKPTMLLLHGLPGNERNLDLAQAFRRAGWNVLTFTYRGAWGSEGTFSLQHAVEDTLGALGFLRSAQAGMEYGIDTSRIVLAGHSMGGYMAAHVAAQDRVGCSASAPAADRPRPAAPPAVEGRRIAASPCSSPPLAGLVLLDAWDIAGTAAEVKAAGDAGRAGFITSFDDIGRSLGPVTAADLADEVISRGTQWSLPRLAPALARVPVLIVYATHGGAAENRAFATLLKQQKGARVTATELATDHSFADKRVALAAEVVRWLPASPKD